MCTQTVAFCDTRGNHSVSPIDAEADLRPGKPVPRWSQAAGPAARKRAARAARTASAGAMAREASLNVFGVRPDILDCALFKAPAYDRRLCDRQDSIVLSETERTTLRHLARQAANCGQTWMRFYGYDSVGSQDRQLRLVCQSRCGTRACTGCQREIREREAYRVEGPWELFLTLTIPRERCSAADAWREVHGWIETMTRELRRELAWARDDRPRKPGRHHDHHVDRWIAANQHIQCAGKLEYAWVIEPHGDGFPHVHMVTNATWFEYDFLRELWSRSCGAQTAWVYGEAVYQIDGACRYLCKYISKSVMTIEILALVYGRRLWACSIKAAERPDPFWFRDDVGGEPANAEESEHAEDWARVNGWKLESSKPGGYALWSRVLPDCQGVIVIASTLDAEYDDATSGHRIPKVCGDSLINRAINIIQIDKQRKYTEKLSDT